MFFLLQRHLTEKVIPHATHINLILQITKNVQIYHTTTTVHVEYFIHLVTSFYNFLKYLIKFKNNFTKVLNKKNVWLCTLIYSNSNSWLNQMVWTSRDTHILVTYNNCLHIYIFLLKYTSLSWLQSMLFLLAKIEEQLLKRL